MQNLMGMFVLLYHWDNNFCEYNLEAGQTSAARDAFARHVLHLVCDFTPETSELI